MRILPILGSLVLGSALWVSGCSKPDKDTEETPSTSETDNEDVDTSNIMIATSAKSLATTTALHSDPVYYTPFTFTDILQFNYAPTSLKSTTTLTNRSRYLIKSALSNYLTIGNSGALSASTGLSSYADTLSKIHQMQADATQTTWFQITSELHSLYSLDSDSSGNLSFSNNRGNAATPASRGYVIFAYDSASKLLQAKARYTYDLTTFTHSATPDLSFPARDWYVKDNGTSFVLVAAAGSASTITFEKTPLDVSMPSDFNPDSTAYQLNSPVAVKDYVKNSVNDMEGSGGKVRQDLSSSYTAQVAAIGDDTGTASAASTILDEIETALKAEGATIRYPKALYLAFRKGALRTVLKSDGIANGTLGMQTTPNV
ncbi:MAG: hypothetical protein M3Q07_03980, partial [Pseudobdellovibrionaceae bacterium]|nr:hypothetical protein [Pseudobdellovibrionaceae bacterium]